MVKKRIEASTEDLGIIEGMDGREVRGTFAGRLRRKGRRVTVDLSAVDMETDNTADVALRRLTGEPSGRQGSANEDDSEDDI